MAARAQISRVLSAAGKLGGISKSPAKQAAARANGQLGGRPTKKPEYIPKAGLKERGWTDAAIERFLGACDKEAPNPHYRSAAPMRLYLLSRVKKTEDSKRYQQFFEKNRGRRLGAHKAAETKKQRLISRVELWKIDVPSRPYERVLKDAIWAYNEFREEKQYASDGTWLSWEPATKESDPAFLDRITVNYIRHEMTDYDDRLHALFGKIGTYEAHEILNRKIYAAITNRYPHLAGECARQLREKTEF
jgi:hypothetical protein